LVFSDMNVPTSVSTGETTGEIFKREKNEII